MIGFHFINYLEKASTQLSFIIFYLDTTIVKGFTVQTSPSGAFQCLGKSKGRRYDTMSDEAYQFLTDYYRVPNLRLADQLSLLHKPLPRWLQREIKDRNPS